MYISHNIDLSAYKILFLCFAHFAYNLRKNAIASKINPQF